MITGEQMVTREKCGKELRGFRKKSFCIKMNLGEGEVITRMGTSDCVEASSFMNVYYK